MNKTPPRNGSYMSQDLSSHGRKSRTKLRSPKRGKILHKIVTTPQGVSRAVPFDEKDYQLRRRRRIEQNTVGIVGLVVIAIFTAIVGASLWPEYISARDESITLYSLACLTVFVGYVYFLISFAVLHFMAAKARGSRYVPQVDYAVSLTKLAVFGVWIFVSNEMLYASGDKYDDVERLIILGAFGALYLVFDIFYLAVLLFAYSAKAIAFSSVMHYDDKKKRKKTIREKENVDTQAEELPPQRPLGLEDDPGRVAGAPSISSTEREVQRPQEARE